MSEWRIKFETKDGQLVQNRKSDDIWWLGWGGKIDERFAKMSLDTDCREKGVRLISYTVVKDGINAIVEWLK